MTNVKKLEAKIRAKMQRQRDLSDLSVRLDKVIAIQKGIGQAFRETVDNMQKDFEELKVRVETVEKKLEGK